MLKTIGTHSGTFHCDEALGCFLLGRTSQFRDAPVTRTRDEETLKKLDCVIDVGGVYDPALHRYDHHQRGFTEVFGQGGYDVVKLSSAGLVYKHFGMEVISSETGLALDHPDTHVLYLAMYKHFIQGVDAVDNGVEQFQALVSHKRKAALEEEGEGEGEGGGGGEGEGAAQATEEPSSSLPDISLVKVYLEETSLGHRVSALNAAWNEDASDAVQDERFAVASEMAGKEFLSKLKYLHSSWLPARSIVKSAILERFNSDESGKIITLGQYCPWKDHLFELEKELSIAGEIIYCLYQDSRSKQWRIMSVPEGDAGSFSQRKPLPAHWRGLRGAALDSITNMPGGTFVHIAGFTGGHETYEGMLALAKMAIMDTCCCCQ